MRVPEAQIAQILGRVDIVEVVAEHTALRQRGGRFWGLCPFHSEKTPSFTVSADKGAFYCFGCGKGGGLIQFVMDVERLSFPEALRQLAERAGIELEAERGPSDAIGRREYVELNTRIAATFHHLLRTGAEAAPARAYLQERGIGEPAVADFKLGWAPASSGWLLRFLHGKQYSDRFLGQSGLFLARREAAGGGSPGLRGLFRARLMFPIASARGEVIAFGGRTLAGEGVPKYVNSAETPYFRKNEQLFGLDRARALLRDARAHAGGTGDAGAAPPRVVVVEGYTDVIALASLGVPAVATLGTAFGAAHARLLKRQGYAATVMFDADDAGRTAALRALRILAQHEVPAAVAPLPPGSDPADLVADGAGAQLQSALESPITASRYMIQTACAGTDLSTAEGKEQAFATVLPYLLEVDSAITREGLLQEVAEQLRLDYDTVRTEFRRRTAGGGARRAGGSGRRTPGGQPGRSREAPALPVDAGAELRLMLAVAVNREQFAVVRDRLEADELQDDRARALYIVLEDCYRHDQSDPDNLLRRIESDELRALVAQKLAVDEFAVNVEAYVAGGVRQVKSGALERKRERLMERVRRAEHEGSTEAISELLADKIFLDSELNKLRGEAVSR